MKKMLGVFLFVGCLLYVGMWFGETQGGNKSGFDYFEDFHELCKVGTAQQVERTIKGGANVNAKDRDGATPLMFAARDGNLEIVTALIKASADVHAQDKFNLTPLAYAAEKNTNPEVISALINAGADVNAKSQGGSTPIMRAAQWNRSPEVIKTLIKAGADVTRGSPLSLAAVRSTPEIITIFIDAGCDVNENEGGWTPLMQAARNSPEAITTLIKAGAKVNSKNGEGETPLMISLMGSFGPETMTLIEAGADVSVKDKYGNGMGYYARRSNRIISTAIFRKFKDASRDATQGDDFWDICATGSPQQVEAAIKAGADIHAADGDADLTPLMWAAAENPNPEVITMLIKAGANVNEWKSFHRTVLMYAAANNTNPEVISTLIKAGADIRVEGTLSGKRAVDHARENKNIVNTEAYRQLEAAVVVEAGGVSFWKLCQSGTPQQVEEAIKGGAKVNAKDKNGESPLMLAAGFNSNPEVITILIKAGVNVNARESGVSILMAAAAFNSNPEVVTALIKAGADVRATEPKHGSDVLMVAASSSSNPKIISALIEAGADVNTKNKNGVTPLMHAAMQNTNPEVISALINAGANVQAKDESGKMAIHYAKANKHLIYLINTDAYLQLKEASK